MDYLNCTPLNEVTFPDVLPDFWATDNALVAAVLSVLIQNCIDLLRSPTST